MATLSVGGSLVTTNDTLSNGVQDNITRLGTITTGVADQFHLNGNITSDHDPITAWSAGDDSSNVIPMWSAVGSRMAVSSGIFTFQIVGIYHVTYVHRMKVTNFTEAMGAYFVIAGSTNTGGSYSSLAGSASSMSDLSSGTNPEYTSASCSTFVNVTNTSTHKVKFTVTTDNANTITEGNATQQLTHVTFIKLN